MIKIDRRHFLATTAATGVALAAPRSARAASANEKLVLAIMGTNGRGSDLAKSFATQPNVEIAYICDPDDQAIGKGIAAATVAGGPTPQGIKDFRRALDDSAVDALVCAAPNHWHAPATLLGCQAGKHVYVEKPCSHTAAEGELMVAAARKHDRVVQHGTQRRSAPKYIELAQRLRDGLIGNIHFARTWYYSPRPTIGRVQPSPPPAGLDYNLWQGPAPELPYQSNFVHYNWHWFWNWGNGELGNNGVHMLDVCRWVMGVDYPQTVSIGGGRYRYDDDQQTPDTVLANYHFGDRLLVWEGLSWSRPTAGQPGVGMEFRGSEGTVIASDDAYTVYGPDGKKTTQETVGFDMQPHIDNFLAAIRNGTKLNADIEEAHKSALLCHLGNIAYRTGHTLQCDPANGRIKNDSDAEALWKREYRTGWGLS